MLKPFAALLGMHLLGRLVTILLVRESASFVKPFRQIAVGCVNDVFVVLLLLLLPLLFVRLNKRAASNLAGFLFLFIGLLLTANVTMVFFRGENLVPTDLTYLSELPLLWSSIVGGLKDNLVLGPALLIGITVLLVVTRWYTHAWRTWAAAIHKPRITIPGLTLILIASRSASLSGRYTQYCPSETHPLPYLYWRFVEESRSRIPKPSEGLALLRQQQQRIGAVPAGGESHPTLTTRTFSLPQEEKVFIDAGLKRLPANTNVVFILAESLGRAPLSSNAQLAPFTMAQKGRSLWLENHFTNSFRTCGAQFSAFCSLENPLTSYPSRDYPRVAFVCLPRVLAEKGYETRFITGTPAEFDNNADWLKVNGVEQTFTEADFPATAKRFSYGIHDEELVDRVLAELDRPSDKPKFVYVITTSNHHPYTVPEEFIAEHKNIQRFKSYEQAYYYADAMLGELFAKAETHPWFSNTLFVVMGDHNPWGVAGVAPGEAKTAAEARARYHTFAFFKHPKLAPRDIERDTTHLNLAPTILALLGISATSDLQNETVYEKPLNPFVAAQENTRGGMWLLHNRDRSFALASTGDFCQTQSTSGEPPRPCSTKERTQSQSFRSTNFDTVQWEVLELQRNR